MPIVPPIAANPLRRGALLLALTALSALPARPARADWSVVGGNGFARVRVWCAPNAPPAAPNVDGRAPAAGLAPLPIVAAAGPGIAGCNNLTRGSVVLNNAPGAPLVSARARAAGGDVVMLPPSDILYAMVTPTLFLSAVDVDVFATLLPGSSATFAITWSGSDPGTAASLEWYDVSGATPTLLGSELRIGAWSESITRSFALPLGNPDFLELRGSAVATSITPEPASVVLLGGGLLLLAGAARRRRPITPRTAAP